MKKRFLPLAIFLLAVGVLAFVVQGQSFIQQALVEPLLYAFWFVALLFSGIPQAFYWAAFIISALIIASLSVPRDKRIKPQDQAALSGNRGSVAAWAALIRVSRESDFSRRSLAHALRKLSKDLMFPDEHVRYHEFEARLEQTSSALPPEIAAYFQAPMPETVFKLFRPASRSQALDLDPEYVVAYLENKLDLLAGE